MDPPPFTTDSPTLFTSSNHHLRGNNDGNQQNPPNYHQAASALASATSKNVKLSKVKKLSMEESWLSTEKAKDLYERYFTLEDCPKSLKLIVNFYRFFFNSF